MLALSVFLPVLMQRATEHHGVVVTYMLGYFGSLTPFIADAAMASSFIIALVILSFDRSRFTTMSLAFAALTASVVVVEMSVSVYLSVVRPVRSFSLSVLWIYALIGLVPLGLSCMMFTLASLLSSKH